MGEYHPHAVRDRQGRTRVEAALEDGRLSNVIDQFLRNDPTIKRINFGFNKNGIRIRVNPYRYAQIARLIRTHRVGINFLNEGNYEPNHAPLAVYSPSDDVLELNRHQIYDIRSLRNRMVIVHECTHAINDYRRIGDMVQVSSDGYHGLYDRKINEASAYIAMWVYGILSGRSHHVDEVHQKSIAIARLITRHNRYWVPDDLLTSLMDTIGAMPIHQERWYSISNGI